MDVLQKHTEPPPLKNHKILCRHPYEESKRFYVLPTKVKEIMQNYWMKGQLSNKLPLLPDIRNYCRAQISSFGLDHKMSTSSLPYKVCICYLLDLDKLI